MGDVAKIWFGGQTRKANNSVVVPIAVEHGRLELHLSQCSITLLERHISFRSSKEVS